MIIFETERLYVRQYTLEDGDFFFRLNSDEKVMQYIRPAKNRAESDQFLVENFAFYDQYLSLGRWALVEKSTGTVIGTFALIPMENSEDLQIGYALLEPYHGKGYASEAVKGGVQHAFELLKLPFLSAVTELPNKASQHVLEKNGFTVVSHYEQDGRQLVLFKRINPDYIETTRLIIFPLTGQQLEQYMQGGDELETKLGLTYTGRDVLPQVHHNVTAFTLPQMRQAPAEHYLFYTYWLVIEKSTRSIVAELGFKGEPNKEGNIEIGYGTMPGMQGRGYMTEAVGGMLKWAASRKDVTGVLAETDETNNASISVLRKNNFRQFNKTGKMLWWIHNLYA